MLIEGITVLEDPHGDMTLADIRTTTSWRTLGGRTLAAGYTTSVWWKRIDLYSEHASEAVLSVMPPLLDDVRFFVPQEIARTPVGEQIDDMLMVQQGDRHPPSNRDLKTRAFNTVLAMPEAGRYTVLLRIETSSSMIVETKLDSVSNTLHRSHIDTLVIGISGGAIALMVLIAGGMCAVHRDRRYVYIALLGVTALIYMIAAQGFLPMFATWPASFVNSFSNAVAFAYLGGHALLSRELLQVKLFSPLAALGLSALAWLGFGFALASLAGYFNLVVSYALALAMLIPLMLAGYLLDFTLRNRRFDVGANLITLFAFSIMAIGHLPLIPALIGLFPAQIAFFTLAQSSTLVGLLILLPALIIQTTKARNQLAQLEARVKQVDRHMLMQQRTHEMQREWLSIVTHEIKTPLAIIDSARQSLDRIIQKHGVPDCRERLERIQRAVSRIDGLVGQMLEQRAREIRHSRIETRTVALESYLQDVLPMLTPSGLERVQIKVPPDLVLQVDPALLHICLANLLTNAVVHGESQAKIIIRGRRRAGSVEIEVESRGRPINGDNRKQLFDRFSSPSGRGHGIGLWACRSIALAHGGDISHIALPDGNNFVLTFPDLLPEPKAIILHKEQAT